MAALNVSLAVMYVPTIIPTITARFAVMLRMDIMQVFAVQQKLRMQSGHLVQKVLSQSAVKENIVFLFMTHRGKLIKKTSKMLLLKKE